MNKFLDVRFGGLVSFCTMDDAVDDDDYCYN